MKQHGIVLLILCGIASFAGCSSLTQQQVQLAGGGMQAGQSEVSPRPLGSIPVSVRPAHGKPLQREIPYREGIRLQEIVDASKVRFHQRKVHIVRTSPQTGEKHRLAANFDGNQISFDTDYALHPGDRVVIEQDETSGFDRMMMNLMGRS